MKKIAEIFIAHRYAIIWTLCYIAAMKFILGTLFNFDIFSADAWIRLSHSHLHGFGGMAFGIMVLAALPLYVATTTIILRTKKPLFEIPVPKFVVRAFAPPAPPKQEEPEVPQKTEPEQKPDIFPDEMPSELHAAFIRARRSGSIRQTTSTFDNARLSAVPTIDITTPAAQAASPTQDAAPTNTGATDISDFPLPPDFDIGDEFNDDAPALPTFTDINFDEPTPETITPAEPDNNPIISQLGNDARADGEFIIYKDNLIIVHSDPDFWIADDTDWFASGKQRPSPTIAVMARAKELNLKPVLYLAEKNILDINTCIDQWRADGITVITDLADLQ